MKTYAVSYLDFFDNELKMCKVSVPDDDAGWRVICGKGLRQISDSAEENESWFSDLDDNFEKAQVEMFDGDMQMNFIEI